MLGVGFLGIMAAQLSGSVRKPRPSMTLEKGSAQIWQRLAAMRYDLEQPRAFEQWVYAMPALEQVIGAEQHLALISLDYGAKHAGHEIAKVIDSAYAAQRPGALPRDLATWVAESFLSGRLDLFTASRLLTRLWNDGETWIPTEFVYIDSELDEIPSPAQYHHWDASALQAKLAEEVPRVEEMQRVAVLVARELLATLSVS